MTMSGKNGCFFMVAVGLRSFSLLYFFPSFQADPTAHLALGIWVNALRCLGEGGLSLPQALKERGEAFSWMLDSGYLTTDGR